MNDATLIGCGGGAGVGVGGALDFLFVCLLSLGCGGRRTSSVCDRRVLAVVASMPRA